MPTRLCSTPGCAAIATNRGRCATHHTIRNRERNDTPNRKHYKTRAWALARRHHLYGQPLCEDPHDIHGDLPPIAKEVHHILGVANDPRHTTLMSLCRPCHARITRQETRGEGS